MNINDIKTELELELKKLDTVKNVYWEYLDFFSIETTWGEYYLGESEDGIGWNDPECQIDGETKKTSPEAIAKAFEEWLTNGRA